MLITLYGEFEIKYFKDSHFRMLEFIILLIKHATVIKMKLLQYFHVICIYKVHVKFLFRECFSMRINETHWIEHSLITICYDRWIIWIWLWLCSHNIPLINKTCVISLCNGCIEPLIHDYQVLEILGNHLEVEFELHYVFEYTCTIIFREYYLILDIILLLFYYLF